MNQKQIQLKEWSNSDHVFLVLSLFILAISTSLNMLPF